MSARRSTSKQVQIPLDHHRMEFPRIRVDIPADAYSARLRHKWFPQRPLSDALRLALSASSASRRSRSLARVGRLGLTGAEASDSR